MKLLMLFSLSLLLSVSQALAAGASPAAPIAVPVSANAVKSYKDWKGDKIQTALNQILLTRNQALKAQTEGNLKLRDSLQRQMSQLQWNLEVANDLSVTDYFVLYLSQQSQADRFYLAAQKLTASEVAELMEAYSSALGMNPSTTAAANATSSAIPAKIPAQATKTAQ